jgi:hypothetical protein
MYVFLNNKNNCKTFSGDFFLEIYGEIGLSQTLTENPKEIYVKNIFFYKWEKIEKWKRRGFKTRISPAYRIAVVQDRGVGGARFDGHGLRFGRFRAAPEPSRDQGLRGIEDARVVAVLGSISWNRFSRNSWIKSIF